MKIHQMLHLAIVLFSVHFHIVNTYFLDKNVDCNTYEDVVPTDERKLYRYIPYYVKIHRCQGKNRWESSTGKICLPTKQKAVVFKVEQRLYASAPLINITLYNHTSCTTKCKTNSSVCQGSAKWNEYTCTCCSALNNTCASGYEWNIYSCACVKIEIEVTVATVTTTKKKDGLRIKYVILLVIGEFILLVTACTIVFFKCCNKDKGGKDVVDKNGVKKNKGETVKLNIEDSFEYNVDKNKKKYIVAT